MSISESGELMKGVKNYIYKITKQSTINWSLTVHNIAEKDELLE